MWSPGGQRIMLHSLKNATLKVSDKKKGRKEHIARRQWSNTIMIWDSTRYNFWSSSLKKIAGHWWFTVKQEVSSSVTGGSSEWLHNHLMTFWYINNKWLHCTAGVIWKGI